MVPHLADICSVDDIAGSGCAAVCVSRLQLPVVENTCSLSALPSERTDTEREARGQTLIFRWRASMRGQTLVFHRLASMVAG